MFLLLWWRSLLGWCDDLLDILGVASADSLSDPLGVESQSVVHAMVVGGAVQSCEHVA